MQHICVFEDNQDSQLIPLVYTRPVFELRCGLFSNLERIIKHYPNAAITLFAETTYPMYCRERITHRVNTLHTTDDTCLFLNGRAIISLPVSLEGPEELGVQDNTLVYARLKGNNAKKYLTKHFLHKTSLKC